MPAGIAQGVDVVDAAAELISAREAFGTLDARLDDDRTLVGLQFIEKKIVTVNVQSVTFSGLNGDVDEVYVLHATVKNNGSSIANYFLQPNGITSNQETEFLAVQAGTIISANTIQLRLNNNNGVGDHCSWDAVFFARKLINGIVAPRDLLVRTYGNGRMEVGAARWTETTTNVTSLQIAATIANGIGNGSSLVLYKVRQA